ncbi:LOB domain-containing protein 22-like [Andrographis paniculata]|uniref:LOB domain-containing protein 22-like n=1 Tax=Andrographis paniculata TaxID=175694 RepID=UPI0021E721A7|nr:LOB domain-containing protein 22-like [Andrographis paniculata]XP_051136611.1 LOB domain-containing protein 22-like [Andrographis paniculata]XP_051136612.1 LOB domain-containing protein 22-like [Andrographis paniculata]XP_051136613.1 LOB domain-containing protein 22-like [Andrographis paniculata]XP_051136614.1 LOB domain-containing protein 22-like [Andrographis paniculata]XP_051136615.1 LOB domain-containing protein 22-like [Andrographis paniculata]XP_051136617.1 LOB domain-containing prot
MTLKGNSSNSNNNNNHNTNNTHNNNNNNNNNTCNSSSSNSSSQACAACKHQRRRCTPECLLAPFFPADQPKMFQNVHRLFGVKHIHRLLKDLPPHHHAVAISSIKYHATMRDKYPVYGCLVDIRHLSQQIQMAQEELHLVLHHLSYYRRQHQQEISPPDHYHLDLGMAPPKSIEMLPHVQDNDDKDDNNRNDNNNNNNIGAVEPPSYSNNCNFDYNTSLNSKENNNNNDIVDSLWYQQPYADANNANQVMMQSELTESESLPIPQGTAAHDYSEMHSFFDNIDRNSFIGCKDTYECSLESSRQSMEHVAENELKNAAACFSLTSVN